MKPIGKYIAITPISEEIKSQSGLILTSQDTRDFRYKKAKVNTVGTDVHGIKDSDIIYFDKHAGHSLMVGDIPYTIIRESDVVIVE
jgi:co-chaperonin GroES (HSP10)|tara:strand:+ start:456 stop:713 length:258 start_codon:yes stop_codon:yes gene_type:complete